MREVRKCVTVIVATHRAAAGSEVGEQIGDQNDASLSSWSRILIPMPENPTLDAVRPRGASKNLIVEAGALTAPFSANWRGSPNPLTIHHQQALKGQMGMGPYREIPGIRRY